MSTQHGSNEHSCASDCSPPDVDQVYDDFWRPIVAPTGVIDLEQVKRELFDFWQVMQRVPKVYCHVTGGLVSKLLTDDDVVCSLADEHYEGIETYCGHCPCQSCEDARKKYEDKW